MLYPEINNIRNKQQPLFSPQLLPRGRCQGPAQFLCPHVRFSSFSCCQLPRHLHLEAVIRALQKPAGTLDYVFPAVLSLQQNLEGMESSMRIRTCWLRLPQLSAALPASCWSQFLQQKSTITLSVMLVCPQTLTCGFSAGSPTLPRWSSSTPAALDSWLIISHQV